MLSLPFAKEINAFLEPYEKQVGWGLVGVIAVTAFLLWKGNATAKTAWLAWTVLP